MIDKLRELLLPTLALTILASLWAVAKVRIAEEDVSRGFPPAPPALMERALHASADPAPDAPVVHAADPG